MTCQPWIQLAGEISEGYSPRHCSVQRHWKATFRCGKATLVQVKSEQPPKIKSDLPGYISDTTSSRSRSFISTTPSLQTMKRCLTFSDFLEARRVLIACRESNQTIPTAWASAIQTVNLQSDKFAPAMNKNVDLFPMVLSKKQAVLKLELPPMHGALDVSQLDLAVA